MKRLRPTFDVLMSRLLCDFSHDESAKKVLTLASAVDSRSMRDNIQMNDYSCIGTVGNFGANFHDRKSIRFDPGYYFFMTSISALCVQDKPPPYPKISVCDANTGISLFAGANVEDFFEWRKYVDIQNAMGPGSYNSGEVIILGEPKPLLHFFGERGGVDVEFEWNSDGSGYRTYETNVILTGWKIKTGAF